MTIKSDATNTHISEKLPQTNIICNCVPRVSYTGRGIAVHPSACTVDDRYDMPHGYCAKTCSYTCIFIWNGQWFINGNINPIEYFAHYLVPSSWNSANVAMPTVTYVALAASFQINNRSAQVFDNFKLKLNKSKRVMPKINTFPVWKCSFYLSGWLVNISSCWYNYRIALIAFKCFAKCVCAKGYCGVHKYSQIYQTIGIIRKTYRR